MVRNYVYKSERGNVSLETMLLAEIQVTQYKRSIRKVKTEFKIPRKTLGRYCIRYYGLPSASNALVRTEVIYEN